MQSPYCYGGIGDVSRASAVNGLDYRQEPSYRTVAAPSLNKITLKSVRLPKMAAQKDEIWNPRCHARETLVNTSHGPKLEAMETKRADKHDFGCEIYVCRNALLGEQGPSAAIANRSPPR